MVEGLATGFGGLKSDVELFFCFRLSDELAEPAGAEFEFKALLFFGAGGADETFRGVVAGDGHAEGSVAGWGCGCNREEWRANL